MVSCEIRLGSYHEVLGHVQVDLICTSPPYNIGSGGPRRSGFRKHGQYDPKSFGGITGYPDTMDEGDYQQSQVEFLLWAAEHLKPNGVLVYNHKPRRKGKKMIHPMEWILKADEHLVLMEEIIWDRGSTHNHCNKLMWPTTERLCVLRKAGDEYNFVNHRGLEFRNDLWRVTARQPDNKHNAPFPLRLAKAVIEAWSKPGDLVCDPYSGSGTTAVAAQQLGRNFIGAEREKKYWKMANHRISKIEEV